MPTRSRFSGSSRIASNRISRVIVSIEGRIDTDLLKSILPFDNRDFYLCALPHFGCRPGACGACATKLLAGNVAYPEKPATPPADGEVLTCCAVPATGTARLVLDI